MMGRPGSGRARNASMSFPRSATTINPVEPKMSVREAQLGALPKSRSHAPAKARSRRDARSVPDSGGRASGSGNEERGQPGLDVLGDLLRGAILGIAESARPCEALIGAR